MQAWATGAAALLALLPGLAAGASWELVPKVEAGTVYETNPRYLRDCRPEDPPQVLCGNQYVMGTFVDARVTGAWLTPDTEIRITPRVRDWNYLESNKDLNNNDQYLDMTALQRFSRLELGLQAGYSDILVRQIVAESATPSDPNAPPPSIGGAGQVADDGATQETWTVSPYLSYQVSQRNVLSVQASYADVTFDERANPFFFDFETTNTEVALAHTIDQKNTVRISVYASSFTADNANRRQVEGFPTIRNETDNYGITATYERVLTPTLRASAEVGTARNSAKVSSSLGGTFRTSESTLVGNIGIRKRSEKTTLNFDLGRSQIPRSDGRQVNQNEARFFVDHNFTQRLSGRFGLIGFDQQGLSDVDRFDQRYWSADFSGAWRMLPQWTVRATYTLTDNESDFRRFGDFELGSTEFDQSNRRLFLSVTWSGLGWRR